MNLMPLIESFILITIAELGDKIQFAVIVLPAEHEFPLLIFIGPIITLALVAGLGVVVGTALINGGPLKYIQLGGGLFIVLEVAVLIHLT